MAERGGSEPGGETSLGDAPCCGVLAAGGCSTVGGSCCAKAGSTIVAAAAANAAAVIPGLIRIIALLADKLDYRFDGDPLVRLPQQPTDPDRLRRARKNSPA